MMPPDACRPGVEVSYSGSTLPGGISGFYVEAFDCTADEGGANFGGVDTTHCFRKWDSSTWRIWNTGCGWEIGLKEGSDWKRHARTYSGVCSEMPDEQKKVEALTTNVFFDGFGNPIEFLDSVRTACAR